MSVPGNILSGALSAYYGANRGGTRGYGQALSGLGRIANGLSPTIGSTLGNTGSALGILSGLQQGGVGGYGSALAGASRLGGSLLGNSNLKQFGGNLGSALGLYSGLKQGGVQGYGQALGSGLQLAGSALGNSALSSLGGAVAAPLGIYSAIKGYQSGDTGGDALRGAAAGAPFGPVGMIAGAAIGALSSAFGGGKNDPETLGWNQYTQAYNKNPAVSSQLSPSQQFQMLAGVMDAKDNSPGHSEPIEQVFGRMGENNLVTQMAGQINNAIHSGQIDKTATPQQIWSQVVNPWLQSKGATIDPNQRDVKGNKEGAALINTLQGLIGDWQSGKLTADTAVGINGQKIMGLQAFGAAPPTIQANTAMPKNSKDISQGLATLRARGLRMARGGEVCPGYDDGGEVDDSNVDYSSLLNSPVLDTGQGTLPYGTFSGQDYNSILAGLGDSNMTSNPQDPYGDWTASVGSGPGQESLADWLAKAGTDTTVNPSSSSTSVFSPSGGSSNWLSSLFGGSGSGSALSNLGSLAKQYAPLLPIIQALVSGGNKNANAPGLPPGFSSGASAIPTPGGGRTQNTPTSQGLNTQQDWYTYGQRPEAQFFSNNQLPPLSQARGGATHFDSGAGDTYVQGPGDGTSDDIPAKLSDGEYVMDAGTVSMLGNGSNEAGARALDQLRENVRKHAGRKLVKGKQFMKAKPPEKYLGKTGGAKP